MPAPKPYREERPWGEFVQFTKNTPSTVKMITVKPGERLSLQTHAHREEFWRIISGNGFVEIGTERTAAVPGSDHFVATGVAHRLEAGTEPLVLLEIAFGDFDENDIVRIEDKYGRA